ncbi:HAD-IA family hydrolase [Caulobacter rhizosphaerae]|jgi:sugar-phosphatase|uniref:HAD-IA family hydrolase n=1 Tax=Caulobacter rhizosphaerae TaxID=2010972 RepID=UPI0013D8A4D4|nr:HAD-IA family hydrolase [Caulobacter rhizosphaerae]GGL27024.1 glycerol-3-phosphatase [Caulobacter rhizosphaerae]
MIPTSAFAAFLFDMDGTVTNSIAATERVWTAWARRHGLDVETFLPTIHGVRAEETIRRQNLAGVDIAQEVAAVLAGEIADIDDVHPIPGAEAFLRDLPADRWAVVTSAQRDLALSRLTAAGLPIPTVLVTAEDVSRGKPAPDGYVLAAQRLGVSADACLVFEDAPAGVLAGEAAGAQVIVITAAHRHPFETEHPTLADYSGVRAKLGPDGLRLSKA